MPPNDEIKRLKLLQAGIQKKVDNLNPETLPLRVENLESSAHTHTNKSTLDSLTPEKISEIHTHQNKNALDLLSEETINLISNLGVDANGKLTFNGELV